MGQVLSMGKAAGGGVTVLAPCRAGEAKSPQGAFAAREGMVKTTTHAIGLGAVIHPHG